MSSKHAQKVSLPPTHCRDAIPETSGPQCQRDSTLLITGDESDYHSHQRDNPPTCVSHRLGVVVSAVEHFGRFALFFFRRRQEKVGPRMHPQQGVEPLKFLIHLYDDHPCTLNDAINPME